MSENIHEGTDFNFDDLVLKSETTVLVDFWAPWCAPCRIIAPVVEELANDFNGQLKVVKVNTDENPSAANRFGVMSIPTLGIFKNGRMVDTVIGAVPKEHLVSKLNPYIESVN